MHWYAYPLAVAAGVVAGFINTLAGSGSAVSLPLLNFLGLPIDVANGTNRVAILLQSVVGTEGFRRRKLLDARMGLRLMIPAIVGAVLGALVATVVSREIFRTAVGWVMVLVLIMLFIKPKRWIEGKAEAAGRKPGIVQMLLFFAIGVYGGFIQVGVGVFLLVGLVLDAGLDLVRANAIKVMIVLGYTIPALALFVYFDQVAWKIGLALAAGNMLGAWIATREAARRGAVFVRYLLIAVVTFAALRYLGIFDYILAKL
jgi:hypothetical protein